MYRADLFEGLLNIDVVLSLAALLAWWWAARAASRFPHPTPAPWADPIDDPPARETPDERPAHDAPTLGSPADGDPGNGGTTGGDPTGGHPARGDAADGSPTSGHPARRDAAGEGPARSGAAGPGVGGVSAGEAGRGAVGGKPAGGRAGRDPGRRVRIRARILLGVLAAGTLLLVARTVIGALLAGFGWEFGADRVVVAAPLVLLPAVAVACWTVPRLWRLSSRRSPSPPPEAPLPEASHPEASRPEAGALPDGGLAPKAPPAGTFPARAWPSREPKMVWPVQVTAVGAVAGFVLAFLWPISPPFTGEALIVFTAHGLTSALLWNRLGRRARTGPVRPRWGRRALAAALVVAVVGGCARLSAEASEHPPVMTMHGPGLPTAHGSAHSPLFGNAPGSATPAEDPVSVTELTEPDTGPPDRRFTLVAREQRVRLASGAVVEAWAFNGSVPGPELRVREGDLVEITVVNRLSAAEVSVHWHGVDVPNAADGVPGVTQDAVPPGGRFTYRFRIKPGDIGTHWYHSHQSASEQVGRGLFGPLIIEPAGAPEREDVTERTVMMHTWQSQGRDRRAFGLADRLERLAVPAGRKVRLRVVITSPTPRFFTIDGTSFMITAVDGNPINGPSALSGVRLMLGAGGRYDIEFTMPDGPVRLTEAYALDSGLLMSPDGGGEVTPTTWSSPEFDISRYGTPAATPFDHTSRFDRTFSFKFDNRPGFYDGSFTLLWMINGHVYPDIPTPVVREGELIRLRFANRSRLDHPMHVHGHRMLLLTRNGRPLSGSPIWRDTVDVQQGEIWEVGFRADNPGAWMDHCHNLLHARAGQMMHLMYDNVESPYKTGGSTSNHPL
ncbi:multicopper oxidase domain-containing protein [Nonomuraea sp. NPDC050643]|uniref:multicopper oxidase domain-containing protein n=1 Tax=Nonomuraea sp. NPDC050643 TaxID=3155660 RepID=UPI003404EED4